MEKNAKRLYKQVQAEGNGAPINVTGCLVVGHVAGAKDAHKSTIIGLYREGKVSPELAMRYGAKPGDHAEAMLHGITLDQLANAGVELKRVQNGQARDKGRIQAGVYHAQVEAAKLAPKRMMVIKRAGGECKTVMSAPVPRLPTAHEAQVAAAVVSAKLRERKLKESQAMRKEGFVTKLSAQEQADLEARNTAKGPAGYMYLPTGK